MHILLVVYTTFLFVFAVNVETKNLVCTQAGKTNSITRFYKTLYGKKGARGSKGFKGEPADLKILKGKNVIM